MYYFPNTVWRLPNLAADAEHFGVVIRVEAMCAAILLCSHKEPLKREPTVRIRGTPFDTEVTHVYIRKLKVVPLPIAQNCKGKLSAEDLKLVIQEYVQHK